MTTINYRKADVDGLKVFYREAGRVDAPALLLLHGFPSASHMFRDLIPLLADRFHIIAPDLPGFGQSDMPARSNFTYTFDHIAGVKPPFLAVWGRNDPFFLPAGAEAFKRDMRSALDELNQISRIITLWRSAPFFRHL